MGVAKLLTGLEAERAADGADGADGSAPSPSNAGKAAAMRIIRVRALPSRSKPISTPVFRRNVAARRRRPDSALGLSGQVLDLTTPLARHFPKGVQKVRRGARPLRLCGDHGAHRRRHWISLDDSVDSFISVARVG